MNVISVTLNAEETPHSAWGILKSPNKINKLKEQDPALAGKNDTLRCSRVSFRLENEVFGGDDREEREIEAQADREVEAITGTVGESPGVDDEEVKIVGDLRFEYEYEIEYENDFSILLCLLHIITIRTHFIP